MLPPELLDGIFAKCSRRTLIALRGTSARWNAMITKLFWDDKSANKHLFRLMPGKNPQEQLPKFANWPATSVPVDCNHHLIVSLRISEYESNWVWSDGPGFRNLTVLHLAGIYTEMQPPNLTLENLPKQLIKVTLNYFILFGYLNTEVDELHLTDCLVGGKCQNFDEFKGQLFLTRCRDVSYRDAKLVRSYGCYASRNKLIVTKRAFPFFQNIHSSDHPCYYGVVYHGSCLPQVTSNGMRIAFINQHICSDLTVERHPDLLLLVTKRVLHDDLTYILERTPKIEAIVEFRGRLILFHIITSEQGTPYITFAKDTKTDAFRPFDWTLLPELVRNNKLLIEQLYSNQVVDLEKAFLPSSVQ